MQEGIFLLSGSKTESLPLTVLVVIKLSENVNKNKATIKGHVLKVYSGWRPDAARRGITEILVTIYDESIQS